MNSKHTWAGVFAVIALAATALCAYVEAEPRAEAELSREPCSKGYLDVNGLKLYHEVTVARADEQHFEYLNCHERTGLLRAG